MASCKLCQTRDAIEHVDGARNLVRRDACGQSPTGRRLGFGAMPAQELAKQAVAAWHAGDVDAARRCCLAALEQEPANEFALLVWAHLELPGPGYLAVLRHIHAVL